MFRELKGLDGSNPLAFLAAVGAFRLASQLYPKHASKMAWKAEGKWLPILDVPDEVTECQFATNLHKLLNRTGDSKAAEQANKRQQEYKQIDKRIKETLADIKQRGLRGKEREQAIQVEVGPKRPQAEQARAVWLRALATAVPAPYLALGKTLSVTEDEFRQFAHRMADQAGPGSREDADFAAAFGSEACTEKSGNITPTEFCMIFGSGQQFFLDTILKLMAAVTPEQIYNSLFATWRYKDERLSFRWDPGEDRRYAYGWSNPSDEGPVLTEHGANLLAVMGLPLFPSVPTGRYLKTTGFALQDGEPRLTWPIWECFITLDGLRSLLALQQLQVSSPDRALLRGLGVVEIYRCCKIVVGAPPLSKLNLTPASPA